MVGELADKERIMIKLAADINAREEATPSNPEPLAISPQILSDFRTIRIRRRGY